MAKIHTAEALRALYPQPGERSQRKELSYLDTHCRRFVELSPFVVIGSSGADGPGDTSPRGGPPGFVQCFDETTLLLPDWPGNHRLDTLHNLIENPRVGLLFLIPGVRECLRVNGEAEIWDDEDLRGRFEVDGKRPRTVVRITVQQAYLHCAKAILRSGLWDPSTYVDRSILPTMGQMLKDQLGTSGAPETEEAMLARYRAALY